MTLVVLVAAGVRGSATALAMFAVAAFAVAVALQELWRGTQARRAMSGEAAPRAVVSLVRRNRRRYGGYLVHVGMAVLFVGVAASSAFQHAHDSRLRVGQSTRVGDYTVRYVRATSGIDVRAGDVERLNFGAVLDVSKDGQPRRDAAPRARLLPVAGDRRLRARRALLRGRVRERGRACARGRCATCGRRCSRTSRRCGR